jgi:hypothetical protein
MLRTVGWFLIPAAAYITPFINSPALGIHTASLRIGFAASRGGSTKMALGRLLGWL